MRKYRVAVLGYYGFGNLGDELLLSACIDMLARSGIDRKKLLVLSNSPDDTAESFGVDAINRWHYRELFRAFRECDTLLLGGGGLFQDITSVKSCAWYWAVVRLAKLCGVKLWAMGQSVGPLRSRMGRMLAGDALRLCGVVHVRDDNSMSVAKTLGCANVIRGCDLVMTLSPGNFTRKPEYMLVNLRPSPELERYVKILTPYITPDTIGAALSPDDVNALKLAGVREIVRVKNFREASSLWAGASCAVGMRLHFGVLSRIFGTPSALLPYDVKVSEFAEQSGVPCIVDEWQAPVKPRAVPDSVHEVDRVCKEILSLQ